MKVPDGWAAFSKSDHRQFCLHFMIQGGRGLRSACSRGNPLAMSSRKEVPDNTTKCRGCTDYERRLSARERPAELPEEEEVGPVSGD
jgi:hypothetical protein